MTLVLPPTACMVSLLAGFLFGTGWWLQIDGQVHGVGPNYQWFFWVPIIMSTCGLFVINAIPRNIVTKTNDYYSGDELDSCKRNTLFFFMAVMLGGLVGGMWIFFQCYVNAPWMTSHYPGLAIMGSNFLINVSGFVFKFGRIREETY